MSEGGYEVMSGGGYEVMSGGRSQRMLSRLHLRHITPSIRSQVPINLTLRTANSEQPRGLGTNACQQWLEGSGIRNEAFGHSYLVIRICLGFVIWNL